MQNNCVFFFSKLAEKGNQQLAVSLGHKGYKFQLGAAISSVSVVVVLLRNYIHMAGALFGRLTKSPLNRERRIFRYRSEKGSFTAHGDDLSTFLSAPSFCAFKWTEGDSSASMLFFSQ